MNKKRIILITTVLILITIACDVSFGGSEEPTEEDISFELTRTSLQQTQTALAQQPEQESPSADDADDDQAAPSTDSDDDEDEDDDEIACYSSRWTGDESVPDGTVFDPGDNFVKTWTLRNAGTCDWPPDTRMVFEDGDQLDGPDSVKLNKTVETGDKITVEVPMEAPSSDGDYTGVWRLTAPDGTKMGKYWVKITVGSGSAPSASFAVTSVSYSMPTTTIDLVCPVMYTAEITANITTNAAGTVTYKWDNSMGCAGCGTNSLVFDSAGTKSVTHNMTLGPEGDYWAKLYIDDPNHQWFGQQNFTVVCNP